MVWLTSNTITVSDVCTTTVPVEEFHPMVKLGSKNEAIETVMCPEHLRYTRISLATHTPTTPALTTRTAGPKQSNPASPRTSRKYRQTKRSAHRKFSCILDMVQSLTEGEAKEILNHLVIDNPAILLTVRDTISKRSAERLRTSEEGGGGGGGSNGDDLPPSWCYCIRCIEMPTDVEKLCCGMTPDYCLSIMPEIDLVITDPMVLHLQMLYRNDLFALHAEQDTDVQRSRRHAAYRQYVLWQHGRLGDGDRRIIPACCVKVIRDRYPDRNNIYTGYRPGRLN